MALTHHATAAAGGTIDWPKTETVNALPPDLDCGSGGGTGAIYDAIDPAGSRTPEDAVLDLLHNDKRSRVLGSYNADLIPRITRSDLVPIWRSDENGSTESLLLTIDGSNVAIFDVILYPPPEGHPAGWVVGRSTACDVS